MKGLEGYGNSVDVAPWWARTLCCNSNIQYRQDNNATYHPHLVLYYDVTKLVQEVVGKLQLDKNAWVLEEDKQ